MPEKSVPRRILLVDDDHLVRKAFVRCFSDAGRYEITTAEGGREALALLREQSDFDVIVADFLMPGIDGCKLLELVSSHWPNIQRVLFTASIDNRKVLKSLENQQAAALIEKPWDHSHIFSVLQQLFGEDESWNCRSV